MNATRREFVAGVSGTWMKENVKMISLIVNLNDKNYKYVECKYAICIYFLIIK